MRDRIVLAPGANGNELIKSLALQGKSSIGLKIMGATELARMVLMHVGAASGEKLVTAQEEVALVAKATEGVAYFGKPSYQDIREIRSALRRMRMLVPGEEEAGLEAALGQGLFGEKNAALLQVYRNYIELLEDGTDGVLLLRKALETAETTPVDLRADFFTLKEYLLSPLEKALISAVSKDGVSDVSVIDLFGHDVSEAKIKVQSYKNCYGAANEAETVLQQIYESGNLDKCTVAVTDTATYGQLFFDYALYYNLPITFGCGVPVVNSLPAKLLAEYLHWIGSGFFSPMAMQQFLFSEGLDFSAWEEAIGATQLTRDGRTRLFELLFALRLSNEEKNNKERMVAFEKSLKGEEKAAVSKEEKEALEGKKRCLPMLKTAADLLALPVEDFIYRFAYVRKPGKTPAEQLLSGLDAASKTVLYRELHSIRLSGAKQSIEDSIKAALSQSVGAASSEPGKLFVTDIRGALCTVRENLYIVGLSASKYPGSPRENYLLLDDDLAKFEDAEAYTSVRRMERKKEILMTLVKLCGLVGSNVYVSYSGMNVSELKRDNASSLIYELFRGEKGTEATSEDLERAICKIDYFAPAISLSRGVGKQVNEGGTVTYKESKKTDYKVPAGLQKNYSPTALGKFFECPRHFLLESVLGIRQPDEDAPFEVISAAALGTLVHSMMERVGDAGLTKETFLDMADAAFDRFMEQNPPLVPENISKEKEDFRDMIANGFEMSSRTPAVLAEEDIKGEHETGIRIHGLPDRVEEAEEGNLRIIDYKTGRRLKHETDDIDSCLQIVIYAYLTELFSGKTVTEGVFLYPRLEKEVHCAYDAEMKEKLTAKLQQLKDALASGDFPLALPEQEGKEPEACKYCKFGLICGKNTACTE